MIVEKFRRALAWMRPPRLRQAGALCWREGEGGLEILLVTTRRTGRWTPPKGGLMDGRTPDEAAAVEAWEEAGARGVVDPAPIGEYHYLKFRKGGRWERLIVDMHALQVRDLADDFPEASQRRRIWAPQAEAAAMVRERGLRRIISTFAPR